MTHQSSMTHKAKMVTTNLSVEQLNFAYVAIACVDIIKLPLIDILHSSVEPKDLWTKVQQCSDLMTGRYKLNTEQKAKCGFTSPNQSPKTPDYSEFDVTLVSALIQNLCPQFQKPNCQLSTNKQLWKEIEEIRRIKNKFFSHVGSSGQFDTPTFDNTWASMENAIKSIQMLTKNKYHSDYLTPLNALKQKKVDVEVYKSLIEKLKEEIKNLKKLAVPWNVKEQMETDITDWEVADKMFVETHSFPQMLQEVQNQPYITFVGAPGSGKTATARHIALKLQKEDGYDILPIREIKDIETYCDPHKPQVFVIDDFLGVYGLNNGVLSVLDIYEDKIKKPKMLTTKILMTCREIVFRNETLLKTFLWKPETTIFLHNEDNELTYQDKLNILKSYGLEELEETILSQTNLSKRFPLLCKLFSSKKKFKGYGSKFFISPVPCLVEELDKMQTRNNIQYGSLVLLMATQNKLWKHMFEGENKSQTNFHTMKSKLMSCCKVPSCTDNFQFIDALKEMEGTYTKKLCVNCDRSCDCEFTFIHESMFEITAHHFGKQFPELILNYMSNDYVANKIKIKQQGQNDSTDEKPNTSDVEKENVNDLCISLSESEYHLLAERLWRDVEEGELYNAFVNDVLNHLPVLRKFIALIEETEYNTLYSLFLSKLTRTSKVDRFNLLTVHITKRGNALELHSIRIYDSILKLLNDEHSDIVDEMTKEESNRNSIRAISWVVYLGHHQILQSIINRIKNEKGDVADLYKNSNNTHVKCKEELVTLEQCRLLCLGCISGDLDTVKILLQHMGKVAINSRTLKSECSADLETTPLGIACYFGYQTIVSELLIAGANVNPTNTDKTPLLAACKNGNSKVINMLIKEGANVNVRVFDGTPLTYAIKRLHLKAIDELIEAGADVNLGTSFFGAPLEIACREGTLNIVKVLLNAGSDINPTTFTNTSTKSKSTVDPRSKTLKMPLTAACKRGHFDVVQELIKYKVDVNKVDNLVTPLAAACCSRHLNVIKLLLKNGATKTEIPNVNYVGHTGVFLKMITLGIDVTKNDLDKTSLIAACAIGQLDLAEQMINTAVDVNLKDGVKTPLIVACYFGHLNVVEVLIKAKVNVNLGNGFITPLQVACYDGNLSIVSILIRAGAHVNLKYNDGTALAAACFFRHVDVVKALIEAGADVNQKSHGETPIAISKEIGDIVGKELIKAGASVHPMLDS